MLSESTDGQWFYLGLDVCTEARAPWKLWSVMKKMREFLPHTGRHATLCSTLAINENPYNSSPFRRKFWYHHSAIHFIISHECEWQAILHIETKGWREGGCLSYGGILNGDDRASISFGQQILYGKKHRNMLGGFHCQLCGQKLFFFLKSTWDALWCPHFAHKYCELPWHYWYIHSCRNAHWSLVWRGRKH